MSPAECRRLLIVLSFSGWSLAVDSTRSLCENARQIQAANWRGGVEFPLVNYLSVAPRARA
jgi:hypothetical protein